MSAPSAGRFRVVRVVVPLGRFVAFLRFLRAFTAARLVRIRCLPFELFVFPLELFDVGVPLAAVEADRALLVR